MQVKNGIDSPIPVEVVDDGASGVVTNTYSTVTALAKDTEVTLVTYTVPMGKTFYLKEIEASGSNRAKYKVIVDSNDEAFKRTYNTLLNTSFLFYNFKVTAGKTITLRVEHNRPSVGDFEARIIGNEV